MSEVGKISHKIIISVGSNIKPKENINHGLIELRKIFPRMIISKRYLNFALDEFGKKTNQPDFINCAVLFETDTDYADLKNNILRKIETNLGRIRTIDKFESRIIDLDIIIFGNKIIKDEFGKIQIPDQDIYRFPHLFRPILDLEPDIILPNTKKPLKLIISLVYNETQIREIDF